MNLLRAELLKARTTRLLLWYGLGLAGFLIFVVSTHLGTDDRSDLALGSTQRTLFSISGLAAVVAILVGTVLLAGEYAHGTINQSFLATPARERLMGAKLAAGALVGAALGVVSVVVVFVLGELWYAGRGVTLHLGHGTMTPALGTVAASASIPAACSRCSSSSARGERTLVAPVARAVSAATGSWATSLPRWMITTSSASWAISASTWLETKTVPPSPANPRRKFRNHRIPSGSRPFAGSSSTSSCGSPSNAAATLNRCRIPSE